METGAETIGIGDQSRKGSTPVLGISDVYRVNGDNERAVEDVILEPVKFAEIAGREVQAADGSEPVGALETRGIFPCSWMQKTALESTDSAQVDGLGLGRTMPGGWVLRGMDGRPLER